MSECIQHTLSSQNVVRGDQVLNCRSLRLRRLGLGLRLPSGGRCERTGEDKDGCPKERSSHCSGVFVCNHFIYPGGRGDATDKAGALCLAQMANAPNIPSNVALATT